MKKDSFKDYVLDQLSGIDDVSYRGMFGGYGIYCGGLFFAIIHGSRLYFKTNEKTKEAFVDAGMRPSRPNRKQTLKNYYEVPADVIEDRTALAVWAEQAMEVARAKQDS